jgi:hypothetical protein
MVNAPVSRRLPASFFNWFSGGSGFWRPSGLAAAGRPSRAIVLSPGILPTTDLYLKGRLEKRFGGPVAYVNTLETTPREITWQDAPLVVVVRYAPLRWLFWLKQRHSRLAGMVCLMDDDMPAAIQAVELPLGYAVKTAWRHALTQRLLGPCCRERWVSTAELARRYASDNPRIVAPGYVFPPSECGAQKIYFYHGTRAHRREIQWLVAVVKQVQQRMPDVWFEVMGTDRVKKMFRAIPRVRVVHPMTWTNYRAYIQTCSYRVGLAPCLESAFNRARSHCKAFDVTAAGAVGVYSDGLPYAGAIRHGRTGLLCKNDPDAWIAAILRLLNDRDLRISIYGKAQEWCQRQTLDESWTTN